MVVRSTEASRPPRGGRGLKFLPPEAHFCDLSRGGRGLKYRGFVDDLGDTLSPSSRRAWIEIAFASKECLYLCVALLAEGVD